jgi:hypothetical protein
LSQYAVFELAGDWTPENREPLGSKRKLWLRSQVPEEHRRLFKYNRPNTGEDWSEKIAAELAELLQLPHARVELASLRGDRGAAVVDFTDNDRFALVHGNEVLEFVDPAYPKQQRFDAVAHTPGAVRDALERLRVGLPDPSEALPKGVDDAYGVFAGYLMLDAWIGNTDRHHENWGVLRPRESAIQTLILAPSFDHASSLGRELTDTARVHKHGDPRHGPHVERYARRARSGLYASDGSRRILSPREAFLEATQSRPNAGQAWLDRLGGLDPDLVPTIVERIPESRMSSTAKAFTCALLAYNAKLLTEPDAA